MADKKEKGGKNPYQDTLNLPQTDFPIRAHAATKEPELIARWQQDQVHEAAQQINKQGDAGTYILHDGPPYANGNIHLGTAFNKILKDMVCKSKRMAGHHVPYVPGWDCHGLPIELKVTTELGVEQTHNDNKGITAEERAARVTFKKQCRDYAKGWITKQAEQFKDLGVLGDWQQYYSTMAPEYEASILESLATFVEKGYITRKGKTVSWCGSCQTVLAAAEIEYKERKDPSTFILFPMGKELAAKTFPFILEKQPELEVNFLIWTTTPWTIPLNRAVVLHPKATYVLLQGKEENQAFIVAKELADSVCQQVGIEKKVELAECDSVVFKDKHVLHPFIEGQETPIILDDSVLLSDGTACVHSAPGCGPEDYVLGIKNNLEIFSPLSPDGKYIKGIKPAELEGVSITDGQIWVLRKLKEVGRLFHKSSLRHSYPHCWRCRNGLMFRATDQWFCDLQDQGLTQKTLDAIDGITFMPDWGKARLHAFVGNRSEWCISRQRQWGVPIPAILCNKCDWSYMDADFIRSVAAKVAQDGVEYWDSVTIEQLQADGMLPQNFACGGCGAAGAELRQERDILDVWFDSGVSHYAVVYKNDQLSLPADLYLEGSDQHRGWFQSSLLSSIIMNDKAMAKAILTHGYVVDKNRHKMSKSLGNVIVPQEVIKTYSRDILRLWVASTDYSSDIVISEKLLKNVAEVYRKIRNTCRFMLSNLYDFDHSKHAVAYDDMLKIDQYALLQLSRIQADVLAAYGDFNFAAVVQTINNYCTNNLSAMYLDILKDRLYVETPDGPLRRSGQTVLYHILQTLTTLVAPVLTFLAEEISDQYDNGKKQSIHLGNFVASPFAGSQQDVAAWKLLEQLRGAVLKTIEVQRQAGTVKHSLEAKITLHIDYSHEGLGLLKEFMAGVGDVPQFLKDWFIVSQVTLVDAAPAGAQTELTWAHAVVEHADGNKCPRCWQWSPAEAEKLCQRCDNVCG